MRVYSKSTQINIGTEVFKLNHVWRGRCVMEWIGLLIKIKVRLVYVDYQTGSVYLHRHADKRSPKLN